MSMEALYIQIYEDIIKKIHTGEWKENMPLPAERQLCQIYHVSRTTIRYALERLEKENFIYKRHGNGNFVKPQVFVQPLTQFYSFTDSLKNDGIIIKNDIINYELTHPDAALVDAIHCSPSDFFHCLTRLRSAKEYPIMLETTYLPKGRFYHLDIDWLREHSLYRYLSRFYKMRVSRSYEIFYPIMPNAHQRSLLEIMPNIPCMSIERFSFEDDIIIEYTRSIVRGDKYKFKVNLGQEKKL